MKLTKVLAWLGKAVVSLILAFAILTGISLIYYNIPTRAASDSGATDHVWQSDKFYSRFTEGIAAGKINNEGYQNLFDYEEGMPIDVLIMGSSHIEAFNVAQSESTNAVLGELMPGSTVYNIGISGHAFTNCAQNLEAALEKYRPKYVIVEAFNLDYSEEQITAATNGTLAEIPADGGSILDAIRSIPYLRLLGAQIQSFMNNGEGDVSAAPKETGSEEAYSALISKMKATADKYGAKLVIFHQAPISIQNGSDPLPTSKAHLRELFASLCEENGIIFVDMTEAFLNEYKASSTLPHGFINTSVGTGHLNKYGHRMIAEALYNAIKEGN